MAKFIRYALAALCFTASVGCLALWELSWKSRQMACCPYPSVPLRVLYLETFRGSLIIETGIVEPLKSGKLPSYWQFSAQKIPASFELIDCRREPIGRFGRTTTGGVYAPLWYPALLFALAGVAALRFRRQFSIRAALIAVSVVAALLGMAVAL